MLSLRNDKLKSVLPMRFCEKVGFFLGRTTQPVKAELLWGGPGACSPGKFFKISMQIELFYSILGDNSLYFHS